MDKQTKTCQNCQKEFIIEPEDFEFYEKMKVPAPTFCPECRAVRRMLFRNERSLYKRKCDLCNKEVISVFSPDKPYKVYCGPCWYSDKWEGKHFALTHDPNKHIFDQIKELQLQVPLMGLIIESPTMLNSSYNNHAAHLKNCYLIFNADYDEDCLYSTAINFSKDSMDMLMADKSILCYQGVNINRCYQTYFSQDCDDCHNVYFSKDMVGCSNCFACANLRNKQYHIFNKLYAKEDYLKEIAKYDVGSFSALEGIKGKAFEHWQRFPRKYMRGRHNNTVSGDYIYYSKNTKQSFCARGCEDSKFCQQINIKPTKDAYDYFEWGNNANLIYDCITVGEGASNVKFCYGCWRQGTINVEYSMYCCSCKDIFGCIGLRNKQYCILNKQYSKEEYYALREKIIQQMNEKPYKAKNDVVYRYGEFFPPELSFFAYNESTAGDEMPLTKQEVLDRGYRWKETEQRDMEPDIDYKSLPDNIKDVKDEGIINKTILCQGWDKDETKAIEHNCTKVFRITTQELAFYRRMNLALPRYCPNCRHHQRIKQRNPIKFYKRKCMKQGCSNEFMTTYAPDRPEIVYCEKCYLQEVA